MKAKILDIRKEDKTNCYLCQISLFDFITNLPDDYNDYDIQREIVTNVYLDELIETVLSIKHIPPIVLVVDSGDYNRRENILHIKDFKILDGLQRTFRLKIIWDTIQLFENEVDKNKDILNWNKYKLSRSFSNELFDINSSSRILSRLINFYNDNGFLSKVYQENNQWFEIWTDLAPDQEVSKMLVLNAGHKPVKTKHQLELLFLNLIPLIKKTDHSSFELIREKQISSIAHSKRRKQGQFHFSHLLSSLLSFKSGEPVTTNTALIKKLQSSDFELSEYNDLFNFDFIRGFISFLLRLDRFLFEAYSEFGLQWLGREVSLVGIMGALGKYSQEYDVKPLDVLRAFEKKVSNNKDVLNLKKYESERNKLELSKINIGTINKQAVYEGIYDLMNIGTKSIDWPKYFKNV